MEPVNIIELAREIATEAHEGQVRKISGLPYIVHPQAVAEGVETEKEKAVAWLHDVLEDCPDYTAEGLVELGIPRGIVDVVVILTKEKGENYLDYLLRVAQNYTARLVKKADLIHNKSDLKVGSTLYDKYELALWILKIFHQKRMRQAEEKLEKLAETVLEHNAGKEEG
jgi:(p)ppGpp synthase/HD superfamily hydrolase